MPRGLTFEFMISIASCWTLATAVIVLNINCHNDKFPSGEKFSWVIEQDLAKRLSILRWVIRETKWFSFGRYDCSSDEHR